MTLFDGNDEILHADTTGTTITAFYDVNSGNLMMSGTDTITKCQQVLSSVTYNNTATNPTKTARTIMFTINDGHSDSVAASTTLIINQDLLNSYLPLIVKSE